MPRSEQEVYRLLLQRSWLEPRRRAADLHQMPYDLADLLRLGDHGENPHWSGTTRTDQRVDLVRFHPGGASRVIWGLSGHFPLLREAYRPYRRMYWQPLGGICCVSSRKNRITGKVSGSSDVLGEDFPGSDRKRRNIESLRGAFVYSMPRAENVGGEARARTAGLGGLLWRVTEFG